MKNLAIRFRCFVLSALLALPVSAQLTSPEKTVPTAPSARPAKSEVYWTRGTTRELMEAYFELETLQKTYGPQHPRIADQKAAIERLVKLAPELLNVDFQGGSLGKFIAIMQGAASLNVIAANGIADFSVELPAFSLRNVNWRSVIGVLNTLLAPRGCNLEIVGADLPNAAEARSISCVFVRHEPLPDSKQLPQPEFESFQLADKIFENQTIEVIVDAIRTAWTLEPGREAAALRLKFHPATKILLVSGPAPASTIAGQVVSQLRKNPVAR